MPAKKDNLPVNADVNLQNGGTITYANEVIAIIAGVAANEIDGIAGMCTSGGIGDIIGRNRNVTRGVKVEVASEEAAVDIYTIVEYGQPIQKVASEVQENVRKAIESMTGLHVVRVDVHVQGVSFEKEKKEAKANLDAAHTAVLESPAEIKEEPEVEVPKAEEPAAEETVEAPAAEEAPVETTAEIPAEEAAPIEEPAETPIGEDAEAIPEDAPKAEEPAEASNEEAAPVEGPAEAPAEDVVPSEEAAEAPAEEKPAEAADTEDQAAPEEATEQSEAAEGKKPFLRKGRKRC